MTERNSETTAGGTEEDETKNQNCVDKTLISLVDNLNETESDQSNNNNNNTTVRMIGKIDDKKSSRRPDKLTTLDLQKDDISYLSLGASSVSPLLLSPCASEDSGCTQDEVDEINKLYETHPFAFEKWLKERASATTVAKIHSITESTRSPALPKRASVTSDLFQQWLQNSPVKVCFSKPFIYSFNYN